MENRSRKGTIFFVMHGRRMQGNVLFFSSRMGNRMEGYELYHNSICCAVIGSERKRDADSENLAADSVVRKPPPDLPLKGEEIRSTISG